MNWKRQDLERLKSEGKIRGYELPVKKEQTPAGRIVAKHYQRKSKGLDYIGWNPFVLDERALSYATGRI